MAKRKRAHNPVWPVGTIVLAGLGLYLLTRKRNGVGGLGASYDTRFGYVGALTGPGVPPPPEPIQPEPVSPVDFARGTVYGEQVIPSLLPPDVQAIERAVGPMVDSERMRALQEHYQREQAILSRMRPAPQPDQFDPRTGEATSDLSTRLIEQDVSKLLIAERPQAADDRIDLSQAIIAPRPEAYAGMTDREQLHQQIKLSAWGDVNSKAHEQISSVGKKGMMSEEFRRAFYQNQDSFGSGPQGNLPGSLTVTGVSTAYYGGQAQLSPEGRRDFRNYQDAYSDQAKLQARLDQMDKNDRKRASVEAQLQKANQRLDAMNQKANTAYQQGLDKAEMDKAHKIEEQNMRNMTGGMTQQEKDRIASDLRNKQAQEKERLKESHARGERFSTTEYRDAQRRGERYGPETKDIASATAKAGEFQRAVEAEERRGLQSQQDQAEQRVREAVQEAAKSGQQMIPPGESFEEAVKKEMTSGEYSQKADQMRLAQERAKAEMQRQASEMQRQAAQEQAARQQAPQPPATATPTPPASGFPWMPIVPWKGWGGRRSSGGVVIRKKGGGDSGGGISIDSGYVTS